jgi:hypothetical protein
LKGISGEPHLSDTKKQVLGSGPSKLNEDHSTTWDDGEGNFTKGESSAIENANFVGIDIEVP